MPRNARVSIALIARLISGFILGLILVGSSRLFGLPDVRAEQLPIKLFTTADGLPRDNVNRIVRDSRGFLWLCTDEGLSRFDGYQFTNYSVDRGLPSPIVSDLMESREGVYWVATRNGLSRFNPSGPRLFDTYYPGGLANRIEVLAQDRAGTIWCGTYSGLYRVSFAGREPVLNPVDVGLPAGVEAATVNAIAPDSQGTIWIGTARSGLYRRWPDGRVDHFTEAEGLRSGRIEALLVDRSGRIWLGSPRGLCELVESPRPGAPVCARRFTTKDGLPDDWVETLFQSSDGAIWAGLSGGLIKLSGVEAGSTSSAHITSYTPANGLSSRYIIALAEDRDGNLWIGTDSGGAMKFVRGGFTTYTEADGLAAAGVDAVFEDRAGELCVVSSGGKHLLNWFDGQRFNTVCPRFPASITDYGWGWNQVTLQDRSGAWWIPTGDGLCRYPASGHLQQLAGISPNAVLTTRDGLVSNGIFRLYEDSSGNIWISDISETANGLSCWDRLSGRLLTFTGDPEFAPWLAGHPPCAFGEDASRNLWIGFWGGPVARYRDGRFQVFGEGDGLPAGSIRSIYRDASGRLWLASSLGGLARIDEPIADHPRFSVYTTASGLSSNDVWCVTEDQWGRIYVGTGRGLDRLDPGTGRIKHYTSADGLFHGKVTSAYRDHAGALWFASNVHGLSRLVPEPDRPVPPPAILISRLLIAGVDCPLSQLGVASVPLLQLAPGQNQLNIDFVGIGFEPGESLRYQYRLEGADKDWSVLSDQRSVNYATLAPGRYRFLVRAVTDQGVVSAAPAELSFTIMPPVWRRWWFLMIGALAACTAVFAAHRARVARLIEIERVRTRIATDLHDDIGSNLSLIAMLSEVARGNITGEERQIRDWFSTIAATSRDTIDAMSDIVWAVNPKKDHLRDLTQRMRRFAEDLLGPRDIQLQFDAPDPARALRLGAEFRREVFLVFKEAINNIARHSQCTSATVGIEVNRGSFILRITDNGKGVNPERAGNGHGLASMSLRAANLGAKLDLSSNGAGTSIVLAVPLKRFGRYLAAADIV